MAQWSTPGRILGLGGIATFAAQRPAWAAPGVPFAPEGLQFQSAQRAEWPGPGRSVAPDGVECLSAQLYMCMPCTAPPAPAATFMWGLVS
jgi:hypothetical protein